MCGIISITLLLSLSKAIEKRGLYPVISTVTILDMIALMVIYFSIQPVLIILGFMVLQSVPSLILACLDTAIEDTADSVTMGKTRGLFLTILATASVISPLVVGGMIAESGFKTVYLFSFLFLVLFLLVIWINRYKFKAAKFSKIEGLDSVREFWSIPDVRRIGIANFALHLFFSWMIIYIPLYLATEMGFTWADIGVMISITLLPFVILQIPVGELADEVLGEKEMLIGGIILMIMATIIFPILNAGYFVAWTLTILLGRTGACVAETMIESYFFKKSEGRDELIEVYRMASPTAFIIGPILGSVSLLYIPFRYIFPLLAIVLLVTLLFIMKLKDTK
jgi:predicted MFS family arabinose efflux permease